MISAENLCYVRFILLLVKEGKDVLAKIVINGLEKKKLDISEFLRINEGQIRKSQRINAEQIKIVYPPSGEASDISKWDITLLSHFARMYFTEDNSLERVAVDKIRNWRNTYFHCGDVSMDGEDFEKLSKVITTMSYSQSRLEEIKDSIESIRRLELSPALEELQTFDPKLCESIEGRLGTIQGQLVKIERTVQESNEEIRSYRQEVLEWKENIRREAERVGEAKISITNVHGIVNVHLTSESQMALAGVLNDIISSSRNVLENSRSGGIVEEKCANVIQDIRGIGGEVMDVKSGSIVYIIKCSSLTYLMYVIDYFYSPRIRYRLDGIEKALGHNVNLTAEIEPTSLKDMQRLLKGGDTKTKKEESTSTRTKAMAFLDKRTKEKMQDNPKTGPEQSTDPGQQAGTPSRKRKISKTKSQELLARIDNNADRCKKIVRETKNEFYLTPQRIKQFPCVQSWLKVLEDIEKKLKPKETVIAVQGKTGEGKSSLLNAVLDYGDVLPTSGIKACTATVVEVVESRTNLFEAEIEFVEEKEWFTELKNLCEDLTDENGSVTKTVPDCNTGSIYDAYCKIIALYGEMNSFDVLSKQTNLTQWLGKTKVIKKENLNDFRHEVEAYIEVQEPGTDRSFWPIVRRVRLKLPDCDVCSSGAVLVDLPGQGDSDAARNKIASSYTEYCDAIWVVTSINRAINDEAAKNLHGEHFRRQLYMDGQLGAVSFICTKTDTVNIKECRRELKGLEIQTKELFQHLSKLDSQRKDKSNEINNVKKEIQKQTQYVKRDKDDKEKKEDNLKELESIFEEENFQEMDAQTSSQLRQEEEKIREELKTKEENIKDKEKGLNNLKIELERMEKELRDLETQSEEKTKSLAEICAKYRNDVCETRMKQDFVLGYKDIEMASSVKSTDKKGTRELQIKKLAENLKVFCCSSTDYQLIEHRELGDISPQVFSKAEDTNIPQLRNYVHELVGIKKKTSLSSVLSDLDGLVSEMQSYLSDEQDMKLSEQMVTRSAIKSELEKLELSMGSDLKTLRSKLHEIFDRDLIVQLKEGATVASKKANATCARWGEKHSRDKSIEGGLHHRRYQAVVRRDGVHANVDFNKDLARPILEIIAVEWNNVFSGDEGLVRTALNEFKDGLLQKRKQFLEELLHNFGIRKEASNTFRENQYISASNKINAVVNDLQGMITMRQRDLSRKITPHIQSCLCDVYKECALITGKGMLEKIKLKMALGIDIMRSTMFEQAVDELAAALLSLKEEVVNKLTEKKKEQIEDLSDVLETLWKDNTILRSAFGKGFQQFSSQVQQVLEDFRALEDGPSQMKQKVHSQ